MDRARTPNLILSPLMESIVVQERLLLRWCWLPISRGEALHD
jgi:hypothetical protein